jgi:hypothetical protein
MAHDWYSNNKYDKSVIQLLMFLSHLKLNSTSGPIGRWHRVSASREFLVRMGRWDEQDNG